MKRICTLLAHFALVLGPSGPLSGQNITLYEKSATAAFPFVLVKPSGYTTAKRYPLYVFLHGVGGRGDGTSTEHGLGKLVGGELPKELQANAETYGFVVLAPQICGNCDWGTAEVNAMISWAKGNLSVDWTVNRNVLTGLSLGAGGVWRYLSSSVANAQNFATGVVVCGLNWVGNAQNIVNARTALWVFHAKDDGVVGYANATSAVAAVNKLAPVVPAYLTTYTSGNHYIWGRVYTANPRPGVNGETVNVYEYAALNRVGAPVAVPTQGPITGLVADAGSDQTVGAPDVNLNGLNSRGYTRAGWEVVDYPAGVNRWGVITAGGGWITATAKLPQTGRYTFRLTVYDAAGQAQFDDVVVTYGDGTPPPTPDRVIAHVATRVEDGRLVVIITYSDGTITTIR